MFPHDAVMARRMFTMPMAKYHVNTVFTSLGIAFAIHGHTAPFAAFSAVKLGVCSSEVCSL